MVRPFTRTLYKFQILAISDLNSAEYKQLRKQLTAAAEKNEVATRNPYAVLTELRPVFKVVAMDDLQETESFSSQLSLGSEEEDISPVKYRFLISLNIDELFEELMYRVQKCNEQVWKDKTHRDWSLGTYPLNGAQFFGVGLPVVKAAVERLSETVAAVVLYPEYPCYKPSYYLPTIEQIQQIRQRQAENASMDEHQSDRMTSSVSGAMRTDARDSQSGANRRIRYFATREPVERGPVPVFGDYCGDASGASRGAVAKTVRKSRIRNTGTDLGGDNADIPIKGQEVSSSTAFDENSEEYVDWYTLVGINNVNGGVGATNPLTQHQKRILERNRLKYYDLASSYLENSHRRLQVKKSHIHGFGLFAKMNFKKHDMIVEYIGEKIRQPVADRRELQYEEEGVGSCYLFR